MTVTSLVLMLVGGILLDLLSWFLVWFLVLSSITGSGWILLMIAAWLPQVSMAIYALALKKIAEYTRQGSAATEAGSIAIHLFVLVGVQFAIGVLYRFVLTAAIGSGGMPDLNLIRILSILSFVVVLAMIGAFIHWLWRFFMLLESLKFRKRRRSSGTSGNA